MRAALYDRLGPPDSLTASHVREAIGLDGPLACHVPEGRLLALMFRMALQPESHSVIAGMTADKIRVEMRSRTDAIRVEPALSSSFRILEGAKKRKKVVHLSGQLSNLREEVQRLFEIST